MGEAARLSDIQERQKCQTQRVKATPGNTRGSSYSFKHITSLVRRTHCALSMKPDSVACRLTETPPQGEPQFYKRTSNTSSCASVIPDQMQLHPEIPQYFTTWLAGISMFATHVPGRVCLGYWVLRAVLGRLETWAKAGVCVANIVILWWHFQIP